MWLLLPSLIVAAAAPPPCPEGTQPLRLDGDDLCAVVQEERIVVVDAAGNKVEAGERADGRREGWWTRWSAEGRVLGETRYEAGEPVEGLGGPREHPRCLAAPPPDGLYGMAEGAEGDALLALPVAVVDGCVGVTPPPGAPNHGAGVVAKDRFVSVQYDGARCQSGTTVEYLATATGLSGRVQVWTRCGSAATREGEAVALVRTAPLDATLSVALLEDLHPAARWAALEAIAARQPEGWTCVPLGRATRGAFGDALAERAMALAATPCLVEPLRAVLHGSHHPLAADALGRLADAGVLEEEVLALTENGDVRNARVLARRLARHGPRDAGLRDALAALLVDPSALAEEREAAAAALDTLFRGSEHGAPLLDALGRKTPCGAEARLIALAAVQARLAEIPPDRLAPTYRPLVGACDLAADAATPSLLWSLEAAPDAPDGAWAILVEALRKGPGPAWEGHFRDLSCDGASDPAWTTHRREAMDLLRARRCGSP